MFHEADCLIKNALGKIGHKKIYLASFIVRSLLILAFMLAGILWRFSDFALVARLPLPTLRPFPLSPKAAILKRTTVPSKHRSAFLFLFFF